MMQNEESRGYGRSRAFLPTAAQRWLDRAFPEGRQVPTAVRIGQEGSMEIRGRWAPFTATGIYQAMPLSFDWRARLRLLPGVWIVAEDGQRAGQGWGRARLWGILPMGERTGAEVMRSQLVRNLAELPWLPPFALVDAGLTWIDVGASEFQVRYHVDGQEAAVHFSVDDQGDVTRAYSPSRPYDVPDGYAEAPWYYEFSEHREMGGMRIPTAANAAFEKRDGLWEYLRLKITAVQKQG